jgi:hypothetical protein
MMFTLLYTLNYKLVRQHGQGLFSDILFGSFVKYASIAIKAG